MGILLLDTTQKECSGHTLKTGCQNLNVHINAKKGGRMKRLSKKLLAFLVLTSIFVSFALSPVYGWNSHGETLSYVLENIDWLKNYNSITITPYAYKDVDTEPYGPNFKIQYLDGNIGDKTTAIKILTTYADEPDWDMDKGLSLSKLQVLTGGSQGFRHQYYGLGFIRIGVGPERAQYWFDLASIAHKRGDTYWTFRFLARALHQIQDLTQPYHGVPAPIGIILKNIKSIGTLTNIASNHHYNLEEYQGQMIAMKNPSWLSVLTETTPLPVEPDKLKSIEWLGKYAADISRSRVRVLWPLENEFFGENVNKGNALWYYDKSTVKFATLGSVQEKYDEAIFWSLKNFASFSRLLLEYAKIKISL
jgi:hypothetical protein